MENKPASSTKIKSSVQQGIVDHGRAREPRFELRIDIDPNFYGRIIGAQGKTRNKLEKESNTQILVPRIGSRSTKVTIKGNTENDVIVAMERLKQITNNSSYSSTIPRKQRFTHFLSISLATDEIKRNFNVFKDEVRSNPGTNHLHESMLQQPEKLHLTISMLVLNDDDKNEAIAFEYLKMCKDSIIDPVLQGQPLILTAVDVDIFQDCKPQAVNVLFGRVECQPLQEIANKMAKFFESRGLIKQERENVALHLTLLNTGLYENNNGEDDQPTTKILKRTPFDATVILEKFKDFYFGSMTVKEIHLSKLNSRSRKGYYESVGILKI